MIYCDGSKKDSHKIGHEDSESRAMPQLLLQEEAGKKKKQEKSALQWMGSGSYGVRALNMPFLSLS